MREGIATLQNAASLPELHAPPGGPVVCVPEELVQQVLCPVQHDALVLGLGHQLGQHGGPTLACANISNKSWIRSRLLQFWYQVL